jgi:hypothetical protein
MRIVLGLLAMVGLAAGAGAEPQEAILPDGRRLSGELAWSGDGRLRFRPSGKAWAVILDQVLQVRWSESTPPAEAAWRLLLHGGQSLSGTFLGLDAQEVRFGTLWGESINVPRSVVVGMRRRQAEPDALSYPAGDPEQDEVVLASDDQLFGHVASAGPSTVAWRGRLGERALSWGQVRGLSFRRQAPISASTDGEHVRIWLHGAIRAEPDVLAGAVQGFDHRSLVLRHAALGTLKVPAEYLIRLEGKFYGRCIEVDGNAYHLGARARPAFALPRADGLSLRRTFRLEAATGTARLVVEAAHLKGVGDGIRPELERGGLRTAVLLNGQEVDYLNRHVERARRRPCTIRVALPAAALRNGENVLELRQTPNPETGAYEDCIVSGLAVELPR